MTDPQKTVFISYRRSTSKHLARSIFMDLRINGYDVFLDVNTIDSGAFDTIIMNQIAARAHFVLLLSPGALERCQNEGDWLRREIEEAIRLQRNIVPIVEEGVDFEKEMGYLPSHIRDELKRFNSVPLIHFYFDATMDTLRNRFLKQPVYATLSTIPNAERVEVQKRIEQAASPTQEKLTKQEYASRGNEKRTNKDYDGAIVDYSEAIRLDPKYANFYYFRGNVYIEKGDLDSAIVDYTEAIRLNPKDVFFYKARGHARKNSGDIDGAITDYNEAIRIDSNDANAFYFRGSAYEAKGDLAGAIADYTEAIRLDPIDLFAWTARGTVLEAQGDIEGAIKDYNEAILLDPHYSNVHWWLAGCHYRLKHYSEALKHYELYVKYSTSKPDVFVTTRIRQLKQKLDN